MEMVQIKQEVEDPEEVIDVQQVKENVLQWCIYKIESKENRFI